ncbi:MAG: hypothetical protein KDD47_14495, partial [Acidobacteria bacterium]|nr:hypothetical protein [Acidobacteriota bacterium]
QKQSALEDLEALLPAPAKKPTPEKTPAAKDAPPPAEAPEVTAAEAEAAATSEPDSAETSAEAGPAVEEPPAAESTPAEPPAEEAPAAADPAPAEEEEAAPPAGPPENLAEAVQAALGSWSSAGEIPSSKRGTLERRFSKTVDALMEAYPDALEGTELDPKALQEKRSGFVDRAETLLAEVKAELEASKSEPEPSLQDLAQQLKEAFAANTIRKGAQVSEPKDRLQETRRKLRGLKERWQELPGQADAKLAKRFEKVFKDFGALEQEREG